tara:strand:- start:1463 stop:2245 length:783 start_codon:yes stop_codon:yes gene_type:complete
MLRSERGLETTIGPFRAMLLRPKLLSIVSLVLQAREIRNVRILKGKRFSLDDSSNSVAHNRNTSQTVEKFPITTRRSEILYQLANTAQPFISRRQRQLLVVGPRNTHELFIAWCHGFKWSNINAIDLFSINKKIQVMDVESMTFKDSTFDTVCMSGVFAYLTNPRTALSEINRVLRPNGIVVIRYPTAAAPVDFAPSNTLNPSQVINWAKELGMTLAYYSYEVHTNSIKTRQITSLMCLKKGVRDGPSCYESVEFSLPEL